MLSSENGDNAAAAVGTDFTRDFYRLVKFESSKSLASSSSKSQTGVEQRVYGCDLLAREDCAVDREQALQSVLRFIAEQQRYCLSRLVQDERRAASVDGDASPVGHETTQEEDDGYFSKISFDNTNGAEDTVAEDKSYSAEEGASTLCDNDSAALDCADFKTLFKTCDNCFRNIEDANSRGENICEKCAECYIECLPEQSVPSASIEYVDDGDSRVSRYPTSGAVIQKSCLDTVLEEQEDVNSVDQNEPTLELEEKFVNFHERATSKEVIDELNRMIRKGEELNEHGRVTPLNDVDESFGCSTGWVHVEQDIDFTDPKVSYEP